MADGATPPEQAVRKSSRTRFLPAKFWENEKPGETRVLPPRVPTPSPSCRACARTFRTRAEREEHLASAVSCASKLGLAPRRVAADRDDRGTARAEAPGAAPRRRPAATKPPPPKAAPPKAAPPKAAAADGWTDAQIAALVEAHATTASTAPAFWERVAAAVAGRDAGECAARWFQGGGPTRAPDPRRGAAAATARREAARSKRARDAEDAVEAAARACARADDGESARDAKRGLRGALKRLRAAAADARTAVEVSGRGRDSGAFAALAASDAPPTPSRHLGDRVVGGLAAIASPGVGARAPPPPDGASESDSPREAWRPKRAYVASLQTGGIAALRGIQAPRPAPKPPRTKTIIARNDGFSGELRPDGTVRVVGRGFADDSDDSGDDLIAPARPAEEGATMY